MDKNHQKAQYIYNDRFVMGAPVIRVFDLSFIDKCRPVRVCKAMPLVPAKENRCAKR
jgi:hypothetical protein